MTLRRHLARLSMIDREARRTAVFQAHLAHVAEWIGFSEETILERLAKYEADHRLPELRSMTDFHIKRRYEAVARWAHAG